MRDYLEAINSRVVIFDGAMGATLEELDLTQDDYGGLQGKCHEALVLNRPDVIQGVHESMIAAGAEVVQTDTFQGSRLKLDEWGLGDQTLEINRKAAEIARTAVGEERFVAAPGQPVVALQREVELLERGAHAAVEDDDAVAGGGEEVAHGRDTG